MTDMRRCVILSREAAEIILKYVEPWKMYGATTAEKTELYRMRRDIELALGAIAKREIVSEARKRLKEVEG